jgi:predicted AAA+ superfamily ATPase
MPLDQLFELHQKWIRTVVTSIKRPLIHQINWKNRLIVLAGMRGVGKTTLLLQHLQETYSDSRKALYIPADHILLSQSGLFQTAWEFEKLGGECLVLDEIQKYPNWNQELKNIYDSFPALKVIVSGSSSLNLITGQYDLSRRAVLYRMKGLSFREYLLFREGLEFPPLSLSDVLTHSSSQATKILSVLERKGLKVLPLFHDYLHHGYYPYFLEGVDEYFLKVNNAMSKVLQEDIPSLFPIKREAIHALQKMIALVAGSVPFSPNISGLSSDLGISRDSVYQYLDYLHQAGIFLFLFRHHKGGKQARKPVKIYLENTNLFYALEYDRRLEASMGALREAFVVNQLSSSHQLIAPENGDLLVDRKYHFEIGGMGKSSGQLSGIKNSYILKDNVEAGGPRVIPLWLLGFVDKHTLSR